MRIDLRNKLGSTIIYSSSLNKGHQHNLDHYILGDLVSGTSSKKKLKVAIKNKQEEVVNNGDRSKKYCAKVLMKLNPKFYLRTSLKNQKTAGTLTMKG